MTDLEHELIRQLVKAAWPLPLQIVGAIAMVIGYVGWSSVYYRVVDRSIRLRIGRVFGVNIVWVRRHSAQYQTPFESGFARYYVWSWGIENEQQRTLLLDALVASLCFLIVSLVFGLLPVALFFLVSLGLHALSAIILIPSMVAIVTIYAIFWAGRYEVAGMHDARSPLRG